MHDLIAIREVGDRHSDLVLRAVRDACHRLPVQTNGDASRLSHSGRLLEGEQSPSLVRRQHDYVGYGPQDIRSVVQSRAPVPHGGMSMGTR